MYKESEIKPDIYSIEEDYQNSEVRLCLRKNIEEFKMKKSDGNIYICYKYDEVNFTMEKIDKLHEYMILNRDKVDEKYSSQPTPIIEDKKENSNAPSLETRVEAMEAAIKALVMMGVENSETIYKNSMDLKEIQ